MTLDTLKDQTNHIVRIIGWNHVKGVRHWIVANSYGKTYGENGFFRIEMGRNLANIERIVVAPRPDFRRLPDEIKKHG
jgi:C1A family cysteine protease